MKVYIGPYKDYNITSKLEEFIFEKKYGKEKWDEMLEEDYSRLDKIIMSGFDWFNAIYRFFARYDDGQKVKVRIDDYDIWSADTTLAYIILPVLKKLDEKKHGAPAVEYEDVPEHLRPTKEHYEQNWERADDDKFFDRWDYVLGEMIWAFEQILKDDRETQFTTGEYDLQFVDEEEDYPKLKKMIHGPNHTAVTDYEAQKIYEARISNGLLLFGKYYQSLWD